MSKFFTISICILFLLFGTFEIIQAQSIKGYVLNQNSEPIPFANLFIKEIQSGTSTDENGKYFIGLPSRGEYELVISSVGYETEAFKTVIEEEDIIRDFKLKSSSIELEEIVVKASKKDPAYAIIQKVIEHKKVHLKSVPSYKTEVYVKATEDIEKIEKKKNKKPKDEPIEQLNDAEPIDPFEAEAKANQELLGRLNMIEMQVTLNYQYPKRYKEERTAYKAYGSKSGLFVPRFGETDFNFYRNMVRLTGIADAPVISPISTTSILSYKYKLISSEEENGMIVHKIKVIPRRSGNSTCSGYLYINEGIWNINRLDLKFKKGSFKFFDTFRLKQDYSQVEDTLWIPTRQEFIYETKQGKRKTFKGNTTLRYSDFQANYTFPPKFFGAEVAVTTREAYKRDSSYWHSTRPEPLTEEQEKVVYLRDSIEAVHNSVEYKDSIDAAFNKVKFWEVVWHGVGFRNHHQKRHFYIGSLTSFIDFEVVGGFRLGPYLSNFKRWENGQMMRTSGQITVGLKNNDVQGEIDQWWRYNPHRLGDIAIGGGRTFSSINPYDAYINQLRASNYILHNSVYLGHRIELFNGFYLGTDFSFSDRKSVDDLDSSSFLEELVGTGEILAFEDYQAFISEINLSYTPAQKFMTEPNRKVVLGSPYPTFSLIHKRGWNKAFSSDINFDYVEASMEQDVILGALGNSKYRAKVGKFINTKDVKFVDLKRFRQSDPVLYSHPLHSFQALDTALSTTNLFFEVHHIHHFNGALLNNIPLIRKTRIRAIVGAGFLYIKENKFRHEEVFAGIERTFKLGPRRRLRVGLYGVVANGNHTKTTTSYKISLDIIDTWKKDWSF